MANPYYDQRYAMARAMREQKQTQQGQGLAPLATAPSAAGLAYGRQAASMASKNPSLRDAIDAIGQGKPQEPKGLLGSVLGNPIAKAGIKAAQTLTIPARVVTSTVREAVDFLDGDDSTKASFGDFTSQIADPHFRVGTGFNIDTGNKFVDGALGFIGDVALDPITYMTFGAGHMGGYVGRLDLATRIMRSGDSVLAGEVARRGRSALIGQGAKLEEVGANKFGVYMFGKRIKVGVNQTGVRIPFTGHMGQIGEKYLAKIRLGITDTKLGERMQRMTMPKDFLEARIAVARGTASPAVSEGLLKMLQAGAGQKAFRGSAFHSITNEVNGLLKQETDLGNLESYRKTVYRFLQDPSLIDTASDAEVAGFNVWKTWLATQAQVVQDGWRAVDSTSDVAMRENYFPQVMTEGAIAYAKSETRHGQKLREVLMADPFANPDSFTPRSLTPPKEFFGHKLTVEDMNIDSLNRIANNGGFTGEFFETDVVVAMQKYSSDLADELGIIERNRLLTEAGFFKQIEEQRILQTGVNADEVAMARARVTEIKETLDGAQASMVTKNDELITTLKEAYNNNVMNVHTIEETGALIDDALRQHQTWVSGTRRAIEEAKLKLSVLHGPAGEIGAANVSDAFPATLFPVLREYDSILDEISVYESAIDDLITKGGQEVNNDYLLAESIDSLQQRMTELTDSIELSNESITSAMSISNILESNWESISAGRNPVVTQGDGIYKTIREILGYGSAKRPQDQFKKITDQIKPPGVEKVSAKTGKTIIDPSFKGFIDSPEFRGLLDELSGETWANDAAISVDRLKRISLKEHEETLNKLLASDVSLTEMRTQAIYAIARDAHLYGGRLPETLQTFYRRLVREIQASAEVDSIAKRLATKKTNSNLKAFKDTWDKPVRAATRVNEEHEIMEELLNSVRRAAAAHDKELGLNFVPTTSSVIPFTNEHISTIASIAASNGKNEDDIAFLLGSYLDNAEQLLGTSTPTIGDLQSVITKRYLELDEQLKTPAYEFGAGKLKRGTILSERRLLSAKDVLKEHGEALAKAKKLDKSNAEDYVFQTTTVDEARIALSASAMKYAAISDAVRKFEAVSLVLAPHGLNVSEDMWRGILKTAHKKFGQGVGQKMSNLVTTENLLREMQFDYHRIFAAGNTAEAVANNTVKSQHDAFVEAYTIALSKDGGENLREVIGKHLNTVDTDGNPMLLDPVDMALKIKSLTSVERGFATGVRAGTATAAEKALATQNLKTYFTDVVIPWAKQVNPSESATVTGAKKVLKQFVESTNKRAVASNVSPLSVRAESRSVEKWFNQFFDIVKPVDDYVDGRLVRKESRTPGLLSEIHDSYSKHFTFFNELNDGYLDIWSLLNGAPPGAFTTTPSSYGLQMARHAKQLQEAVDQIVSRKLVRENARLIKGAASASDEAYRAQELQAAFKNPDLSDAALKELGFTKDMKKTRDAVLAHQAYTSTGAYAKALSDKETVEFLDSAALYDFGLFDEGFVVGSREVPVYQDTVKDVQLTANAAKRKSVAKAMQDVDDEENRLLLEISRKYVLQQKGVVDSAKRLRDPKEANKTLKFKSNEARTAYRREMQAYETRSKPTFDARRASIQRDLDTLPVTDNTTVTLPEGEVPAFTPRARTQIDTRNEPVFAKMPDGQRLVFSKAESESLFATPLLPLEVKAVKGEIRVIRARMKEIEGMFATYRNNNARLVGLDRTVGVEMEMLAASLIPLEYKLLVSDMGTRQMALYKVSQLVHGDHFPVAATNTAEEAAKAAEDAAAARTNFLQGWSNIDAPYKRKRGKLTKDIRSSHRVELPAEDLKANTTVSYYINRDNVRYGVTPPVVGQLRTDWEKTQVVIESMNQNSEQASNAILRFAKLEESEKLANQALVDAGLHYTPSRYTSQMDVGVRRNTLQTNWSRTTEATIIREEEELASLAGRNRTMQAVNSESRLLQKAATDARKIAEESTIELDDFQMAIRNNARSISTLETQALEAAGIKKAVDITEVGPRASYTVGNKTYLVPSFTEMLSNPSKWAREYLAPGVRGGKPGTKYKLFDELTKPIMRPVFTQVKMMELHEQASFALQMAHSAFDDGVLLSVKQFQLSGAGERISEIQNLLTSHMSDVTTLSRSIESARAALKAEQQLAQKELTKASLESVIGPPGMAVTTSGGKKINISQLETEQDFFQFAEEIKQLYGSTLTPEQILSNPNNLVSTLKHRQSMFDQLDVEGLWDKDLAERINQWKFDNNDVMRAIVDGADDPEGMAVAAAIAQAQVAEGRFFTEQLRAGEAQIALNNALTPRETEKIVKQVADGFVKAGEKFNLPGLQANKEAVDIITNMARIGDGRTARELGQFLSKYTSFFKAYSTLSPGFHVRNSISNGFQMFAGGAEIKNLSTGLPYYTSFGKTLASGGNVEEWLLTVPEAFRAQAKIASDVHIALAGGRVEDAFKEFIATNTFKLADNKVTQASRKFGNRVEGSARFLLAFDSAMKGMDFYSSFNKTKRFLFDYNQTSALDDSVKNIIPFWTWMSRNLPLQITNQWNNPKPYIIYEHFADNFGIGKDEVVPDWMRAQGALSLGGGNYLTPDIPSLKAEEMINQLNSPKKMISYVNPLMRVPLELAGGTKFFNDSKFSGKYTVLEGKWAPLIPLLAAIGQVETNSKGQYVAPNKAIYGLTSTIPMLGQADRIFPSSDLSGGDGYAFQRYLGIPIRGVNAEAKDNVLKQKMNQLLALQAKQNQMNKAG